MLKAYNQYSKLIHIIESSEGDHYTCPVCREKLTRKFGAKKQYFAHPKGLGEGCELKLEIQLKQERQEMSQNNVDLLKEFYDRTFFENVVELSDYKSEEGYFLTQQQKEIIFSDKNRIVVSALAGSAKSSTLYYYCKERPSKKILYVVYNKSQQIEASHTFGKLKNVEIKTVHGLAYKHVGRYYQDKLTFNYGVVDIIKDLNLDWNKDMQLASQVKAFMNEYMLSDYNTFEELEIFDNIKGLEREKVILMCEKLWKLKKVYKNGVKVEHDFYLKLFQLGRADLSHEYDIICLDESQDSSMLTLSWILNANTEGVVMVGDHYQSLYKWRNSVNIMQKLAESFEYKLTTSFRISQNMAELSNILVKAMTGDEIGMTGFNKSQKIVQQIDRNKQHAILCRSNARIFSEAIENADKKIFYNGGFKGYNFNNVKDAYYFSSGMATKNPLFTKFKNYIQMREYAEEVNDIEILSLIRVIQKYGSRIPSLVDGLISNVVEDSKKCDIWLSSIHKSKGSTITMPILIADDHYDLSKIEEDLEEKRDIFEECCCCYVAITRCAGQIELSQNLKDFLLSKLKEN